MHKNNSSFEKFIANDIVPQLPKLESIRNEINKSGKRNKLIFSGLYTLSVVPLFAKVNKYTENEVQAIILTFFLFAIFALLFIFIKPYRFVEKEKTKEFKSQLKYNIIKNTIFFLNPELSYKPRYKTNKENLTKSKLFPNITEYTEDDGIIGQVNNCKIKISGLHLMNGFKKTFDGIFIHLKFEKVFELNQIYNRKNITRNNPEYLKLLVKDNELIQVLDSLNATFENSVKVSFLGKHMFIKIPFTHKLFEASYNYNNDKRILSDLWIINKILFYINKLSIISEKDSY